MVATTYMTALHSHQQQGNQTSCACSCDAIGNITSAIFSKMLKLNLKIGKLADKSRMWNWSELFKTINVKKKKKERNDNQMKCMKFYYILNFKKELWDNFNIKYT